MDVCSAALDLPECDILCNSLIFKVVTILFIFIIFASRPFLSVLVKYVLIDFIYVSSYIFDWLVGWSVV